MRKTKKERPMPPAQPEWGRLLQSCDIHVDLYEQQLIIGVESNLPDAINNDLNRAIRDVFTTWDKRFEKMYKGKDTTNNVN